MTPGCGRRDTGKTRHRADTPSRTTVAQTKETVATCHSSRPEAPVSPGSRGTAHRDPGSSLRPGHCSGRCGRTPGGRSVPERQTRSHCGRHSQPVHCGRTDTPTPAQRESVALETFPVSTGVLHDPETFLRSVHSEKEGRLPSPRGRERSRRHSTRSQLFRVANVRLWGDPPCRTRERRRTQSGRPAADLGDQWNQKYETLDTSTVIVCVGRDVEGSRGLPPVLNVSLTGPLVSDGPAGYGFIHATSAPGPTRPNVRRVSLVGVDLGPRPHSPGQGRVGSGSARRFPRR